MNSIIAYISEVCIKKFDELKGNFFQEPQNLAEYVIDLHQVTDDLCRKMIEQTIQEIDEEIRKMPARKKNWHVERRNDPKSLTTSVGEVRFLKTLYTSKNEVDEDGKPVSCYLIDKVLGLAPNQTMTEDAIARVYEEAVQTSYRKGGEAASPNGVSKGTVKNILHDIKFPPNFRIPMIKKTVDYLYIDADEDHYHLQFQSKKEDLVKNENGYKCNGAITKLIYVFEGIEPDAPKSKRHHLVNTHYFCRGDDIDNKSLWKEVFAYIDATYDVDRIKRIYINSDGGTWIRNGYRGLSDITFVLDEFHLSKYLLKMTGHLKDSREDGMNELRDCIRNKTKKDFQEVVKKLKACTSSEKIHEKIDKAAAYIDSNWTAAKYRLQKKAGVVGCSAEGHVYHVLSSRMSTQAMGWSRHGAAQMARLREYFYNKGNMLELAKYQRETLSLAAGGEELVLSASQMMLSEKANRTKNQKIYGKYAEAMSGKLSVQNRKKLHFQLLSKI